MTKRENLLSLYRRKGYEKAPIHFNLCPTLLEKYKAYANNDAFFGDYFGFSRKGIGYGKLRDTSTDKFLPYYDKLKEGTRIDLYGVAHEPGGPEAKHMTYMRHPLEHCDSLDMMKEYPYPDYQGADYSHQKLLVDTVHNDGKAACGDMQCTIWERAWYIRGMEELMMDMMSDDPMAEYILDKTTEISEFKALKYVEAGCDMLFLGDDIGMQYTIMMSERLYSDWIKPRLTRIIKSVRAKNPDVIIAYHSCGYIEPFIPHLIEAGIDVLNPIQTECMSFEKIHAQYGDVLSFDGTVGTQTVMPFGTPDDVRREVFKNLEIAGDKGGLLCCPTHILEPEVPWENVLAYVKACNDFK